MYSLSLRTVSCHQAVYCLTMGMQSVTNKKQNIMKIKKYTLIPQHYYKTMFLALAASYIFTACSDDDSLGEAPRLFRPVTSLEV